MFVKKKNRKLGITRNRIVDTRKQRPEQFNLTLAERTYISEDGG